MPMTLGEFLQPLGGNARQRELVLTAMYYLQRYEDKEAVTTNDISTGFVRARHTRGRKITNIANVLNGAAPYAHSPGRDGNSLLWSLTDTGEKYVRTLLNLPEADAELEHDVSTLRKLAAKIPDPEVQQYVDEAILCLSVGALRAATVFLWVGAVMSLRDRVWAKGAPAIDTALKNHNPKARDFKKQDDFSYVNDAALLQIAEDLAVLDKSQKTLLGHALDLRNNCGHPVKYNPGAKKVSAFVEDVVGIVWP
jgi:hypothetical protein